MAMSMASIPMWPGRGSNLLREVGGGGQMMLRQIKD